MHISGSPDGEQYAVCDCVFVGKRVSRVWNRPALSYSESLDLFTRRMRRCHVTRFQVCFSCDSVHLASRLVQDMAQVFGISSLTCDADFPKDMEVLRQLLVQVSDYNGNRVRLSTDMADMCNAGECVRVCVYLSVSLSFCVSVFVSSCVCSYVCASMCMCMRMCLCVYV